MKNQLLLNRNEVVLGPAPVCLQVLHAASADKLARYFDGYSGSILAPELAKRFSLPRSRILIGYGAEEILRLVFNSLQVGKSSVLTHELHFGFYAKYLAFRNIKLHTFRITEGKSAFSFDIEDCVKKIHRYAPQLVLITTPNNPSGNVISVADAKRILRRVSSNTLVILDEAYFGFDDKYDAAGFRRLLDQFGNLMILRSFSKQYALAGLRMGYALCGKNIKAMLRYQDPYLGGNRILEEVALAALTARMYYRKLARTIISDREYFIRSVNALDHFVAFDSRANLVLVKVNAKAKPLLVDALDNQDVLIAKFMTEVYMRVTIGMRVHTDSFLGVLRTVDRRLREKK